MSFFSSKPKLHIHSGRIIDPSSGFDQIGDLYIADGLIVGLGQTLPDFQADQQIDAGGLIVCPGLVDLSARLRGPGNEHCCNIDSETTAAASAGITTLCCPPDTDPILDTPAVAELIRDRADRSGKAHIITLGALTQGLEGTALSNMAALQGAGCIAFSNARRPIHNTLVIRRAMEYAATFGLTVFLDPEDPWLKDHGCVHEGVVSARLGLPGIPEAAETVAVARDLALIEQTGVRAHFCRISSAKALRMIARARHDGLPITADVTPHHLYLTEMDVADFNPNCHVSPPFRTQEDREALRKGLAQGCLTALCSDHWPHEEDAKAAPFPSTAVGISALETLLPLTMRLVDEGCLDLTKALAAITSGPAQILGLETTGTLQLKAVADVCLFDPNYIWYLQAETMVSNGYNSPFLGWEFEAKVRYTVLAGELVFDGRDRTEVS